MKQAKRPTSRELRSSFIVRVIHHGEIPVITVHNLRSREVLEFGSWEALLGYLAKQPAPGSLR
jgi:hypothetical protein